MEKIFRIYQLKEEALLDLYRRLDKDLRPMPKKSDGSIDPYGLGLEDNDVDALRHAFISGVYTLEYNASVAEMLGRLQEFSTFDSRSTSSLSENMDLWNNSVGRVYGKKAKSWDELYQMLMKSLKEGELIIEPSDKRKYRGDRSIKRQPKSFVIKIKENKTGANTEFLDVRRKLVLTKDEFISAIRLGRYPGYAIRRHTSGEFPYSTRDRFRFNNLG